MGENDRMWWMDKRGSLIQEKTGGRDMYDRYGTCMLQVCSDVSVKIKKIRHLCCSYSGLDRLNLSSTLRRAIYPYLTPTVRQTFNEKFNFL